jgi:hypothetical protein
MIQLTVPIYYKDFVPRAKKNPLIGMNWMIGASNTFVKGGETTSAYATMKKKIHELILKNKDLILSTNGGEKLSQVNGYHVDYKVYIKRDGTDGHNVRSAIEKMFLDALQGADIIDDDRYAYTSYHETHLDRIGKPRCEITISQLDLDYHYEIKKQ